VQDSSSESEQDDAPIYGRSAFQNHISAAGVCARVGGGWVGWGRGYVSVIIAGSPAKPAVNGGKPVTRSATSIIALGMQVSSDDDARASAAALGHAGVCARVGGGGVKRGHGYVPLMFRSYPPRATTCIGGAIGSGHNNIGHYPQWCRVL
jgi:hypothetical protein